MEGAKNVFEFAKGLNIDNEIYNFSWEEYNKVLDAKPWRKELLLYKKNKKI